MSLKFLFDKPFSMASLLSYLFSTVSLVDVVGYRLGLLSRKLRETENPNQNSEKDTPTTFLQTKMLPPGHISSHIFQAAALQYGTPEVSQQLQCIDKSSRQVASYCTAIPNEGVCLSVNTQQFRLANLGVIVNVNIGGPYLDRYCYKECVPNYHTSMGQIMYPLDQGIIPHFFQPLPEPVPVPQPPSPIFSPDLVQGRNSDMFQAAALFEVVQQFLPCVDNRSRQVALHCRAIPNEVVCLSETTQQFRRSKLGKIVNVPIGDPSYLDRYCYKECVPDYYTSMGQIMYPLDQGNIPRGFQPEPDPNFPILQPPSPVPRPDLVQDRKIDPTSCKCRNPNDGSQSYFYSDKCFVSFEIFGCLSKQRNLEIYNEILKNSGPGAIDRLGNQVAQLLENQETMFRNSGDFANSPDFECNSFCEPKFDPQAFSPPPPVERPPGYRDEGPDVMGWMLHEDTVTKQVKPSPYKRNLIHDRHTCEIFQAINRSGQCKFSKGLPVNSNAYYCVSPETLNLMITSAADFQANFESIILKDPCLFRIRAPWEYNYY